MDDIGVHMAEKPSPASQRTGALLVRGMPAVLAFLSTLGMIAMQWVGGPSNPTPAAPAPR